MSGFEQAQANSNTERILNTVIPKMVELQEQTCNKVHDEVETVTSIFNRMNNDVVTYLRNLDTNIREIKEAQNIFTGYTEALLVRQGFPSASDLLKQKEIKVDK